MPNSCEIVRELEIYKDPFLQNLYISDLVSIKSENHVGSDSVVAAGHEGCD